MLIYIDTDSGVWGVGEQNLVIFEAEDSDIWHLERYSDDQIIQFGIDKRSEGW